MGERIFSKYQYAKEATRGTIVPAAKILVGADIKPIPMDWKPLFPNDALGVRGQSSRGLKTELFVEDAISIPRMYFQGLPLFFMCGLKGGVTATPVTNNNVDYSWNFTPSWSALNNPNTFTLEAGDDTQAFVMEYGMFKDVKISGEIAQDGGESAVKIEANYFGRQIAKQAFTGGLSVGATTVMSAKKTSLYSDSNWSSAGNTVINNVLRGFEIDLAFGNHPKFFGSSNLYFDAYGEGYVDALITLTLEGGSAANTMYDECDAQSYRVLRLKTTGDTIANTNSVHTLQVDVYGQWERVVPLNAESNNNNLHQALFHGLMTSDLANMVALTVITNTNTV